MYKYPDHGELTAYRILAVRRESLAFPGDSPSANADTRLWKDVARRFSTVGVKRPRKVSSSSTSDCDIDSRPRKRQARKSFAGLTKEQV